MWLDVIGLLCCYWKAFVYTEWIYTEGMFSKESLTRCSPA
jgi:hypothetical protein